MMQIQTIFMIIAIGIFASISYCSGDTCYCRCCAGNFCTPTLQGTIVVSSCALTSCKSECQNQYPSQCTNGAGSTNYQCTSDSGNKPNWIGKFDMANRCDKSVCCCPIGKMTISNANANTLHVQCQFVCPSGSFMLNETIPTPSGFSSTILFLSNPIQITLSQDSRTIQLANVVSPECSETATRNGAIFRATINLAFVSLLAGLMTFKVVII